MEVARRYKTLGFSVPPMMATRIDEIVRERQFTRSELFREMFRAWEKADQRARPDPDSDAAIMKLFAEVKEEERRNPTPLEERLRTFEEIRQDLQGRAQALGLEVTEDGEILEKTRV
jgi:metal-responsive CopG/Arc/MetJ family transcriptional regulator